MRSRQCLGPHRHEGRRARIICTAHVAIKQRRKITLNKFAIDYIAFPQPSSRVFTHLTNDPIEVEGFLMHLLAARCRLSAIRHDGILMTSHQFDRMLKVAAERTASELLRESLALDAAEIKDRFGFAA